MSTILSEILAAKATKAVKVAATKVEDATQLPDGRWVETYKVLLPKVEGLAIDDRRRAYNIAKRYGSWIGGLEKEGVWYFVVQVKAPEAK